MAVRLLKVVFVLVLGLWALITVSLNFMALQPTYDAVEGVTSMRNVPAGMAPPFGTSAPFVVWAGVATIVLGKAAAALCLLFGGLKMFGVRAAPAEVFNAAKSWALVGGWVNVLWLFLAFTFAGEIIFYMFMSPMGAAEAQTAFRYAGYFGLIMLFVGQRD